MVDVALVKIWGELVGAVRWIEDQRLAAFEYDQRFLQNGWDLAPIKMPLRSGANIYRFPELRRRVELFEDTFKGLPGLLADALPDKYGNQLIDLWLARNGRPPGSMNPVEQLCFIGSRGMGALEFEPAQLQNNKESFSIEITSLVATAKEILNNKRNWKAQLDQQEEAALTSILKIGTSAGGARPKAVIAYNATTGQVRSGQATAPKGFEHWLLKLDGVHDVQFGESHGWGRVEYAYYLMAQACGIEMMPSKLLEENGRAHFMTKRFDREGGDVKHHIQTLCGIQHFDYQNIYAYSYEQLFQTMRILRLTYPEAEQMYRRMVFNVVATNCDDHTKNFAFRLRKGQRWELAPAYDVCFSYDESNIWVNQQTLSINGKNNDFKKEDLLSIARTNNIKQGEKILHEINQTVKKWMQFAKESGVRPDLQKHIQHHLHTF